MFDRDEVLLGHKRPQTAAGAWTGTEPCAVRFDMFTGGTRGEIVLVSNLRAQKRNRDERDEPQTGRTELDCKNKNWVLGEPSEPPIPGLLDQP